MKKITDVFTDEIIVFSSPGLAIILLFRTEASNLKRIVELEEEIKSIYEVVAKEIMKGKN